MTIRTARSRSSAGYLFDVLPDMTPTFPTNGVSGLAGAVHIEQAKGVLPGKAETTLAEAFNALRKYARDNNRKLSSVAQDVVHGIIPAESLLPPNRN